MSAPLPEYGNTLSLTERRLFSLYMLYPELDFDPEDRESRTNADDRDGLTDQIDSSPASTVVDGCEISHLSSSTARTTPLRSFHLAQLQRAHAADTIVGYLRRVRQSDLPEECRLCFASLAQGMGTVSTGLTPSTNGRYRINNTFFTDRCAILLREIQILSNRTREQVRQIGSLKSRVIFQTTPSDNVLWAVYRQRALLIIQTTALPCAHELYLIDRLARLYHSVVYRPSQILIDQDEIEPASVRLLNSLYDAFFTWPTTYRQWCFAMTDLKRQYVAPLAERILTSAAISAGVQGMQRAKRRANVAIRDPGGPRMLPMDERTLTALNLSARRKEAVKAKPVRGKAGSRRQKTI